MRLPAGTEIYVADVLVVIARGLNYTDDELDSALSERVQSILWDDAGSAKINEMLASLSTTSFQIDQIDGVLAHEPTFEGWRIGEAFAEAYLVDHHDCHFPWPMGRDLRNSNASTAGTDLVGFQCNGDEVRFAFAEVKTSREKKWPPQVVTKDDGLEAQLRKIRDFDQVKRSLVLYLGHRAYDADWRDLYERAATRYFKDSTDVSLFGVLIRDVSPMQKDLEKAATNLAKGCPSTTKIELRAIYFPNDTIVTLVDRVKKVRRG